MWLFRRAEAIHSQRDARTVVNDIVRVVTIEDQREIREGLRYFIDNAPGFRCTGCFGSVEEALPALTPGSADIVLMDLALPGMSGIEGIRLIHARDATVKLVALTIYEDDERIFAALCAGASGYLLKKTPPPRLFESLQEVVAGGAPMSPEVAGHVLALFRDFRPAPRGDHRLTPHELRLLGLLTDGHSYKSAGAALGSSVNTVAFHMKSIYAKLHVHSKSEAVAKALRERLVR
jgi:DNA-binding NarL/FixJ family response regulator